MELTILLVCKANLPYCHDYSYKAAVVTTFCSYQKTWTAANSPLLFLYKKRAVVYMVV